MHPGADKICGKTIPVDGPMFGYTLREPIGVVAAVIPWNFPLVLAALKAACAPRPAFPRYLCCAMHTPGQPHRWSQMGSVKNSAITAYQGPASCFESGPTKGGRSECDGQLHQLYCRLTIAGTKVRHLLLLTSMAYCCCMPLWWWV